jgi:glycosyltransferase involved in cell wall biosynthesis
MRKNVCMFVWNHFTNDARVLRECTALSERDYKVDLICIQDPSDKSLPNYEERNEFFHVHRVNRYPLLLLFLTKVYRTLMKNKLVLAGAALLWVLLMIQSPVFFGVLTLATVVMLKTKVKVVWIRGNIILHMILKGYRGRYDIYHSNDLNTLPQGTICAKVRMKKKKLIYDSHEVQTSRTGYTTRYYGDMEKYLLRFVDRMVVENHTRAKYNEELYGFYPHVVYNYPFKIENVSTELPILEKVGLATDDKVLLYQGGIQEGRGLENLIEAFPHFNEGVLVFIGDGKLKPTLLKMVEERNLEDRIKFIPKVPLEHLPKYTKNAYLGFQVLNNVCFNHYSASSNKLFEYMMAGVPVVACEFPEIKKVVEGEGIGLCVDSHDPTSIASAVNYMLEHPDFVEECKRNCMKAKDKYNWELEQKKLLDVYQKLA